MMMKQQIIRQIMYFTMSKAENKALFGKLSPNPNSIS